ncbi:uncharacterized protein LOC132048899 [Lycium ferocissimum]|uniref:uncharacterized protein LOC132048899 n=1 Tax=Lycium ferocissimum TaxID=112874 RepID=UPI002815EA57|nr:uncharacterized protein LOC132048899 [Lycium ferocissimum]
MDGDSSQWRPPLPRCPHCRGRHSGECYRATGACFTCGQQGHFMRDCPLRGGAGGAAQPTGSIVGSSSPSVSMRPMGRGILTPAGCGGALSSGGPSNRLYALTRSQDQEAPPDAGTGYASSNRGYDYESDGGYEGVDERYDHDGGHHYSYNEYDGDGAHRSNEEYGRYDHNPYKGEEYYSEGNCEATPHEAYDEEGVDDYNEESYGGYEHEESHSTRLGHGGYASSNGGYDYEGDGRYEGDDMGYEHHYSYNAYDGDGAHRPNEEMVNMIITCTRVKNTTPRAIVRQHLMGLTKKD